MKLLLKITKITEFISKNLLMINNKNIIKMASSITRIVNIKGSGLTIKSMDMED